MANSIHGKTNAFVHEPVISEELKHRLAGAESNCLYPLCNTCRDSAGLELLLMIATSLAGIHEALKEKLK